MKVHITIKISRTHKCAAVLGVISELSDCPLLADNGNPARAAVSVPAINEHQDRSQVLQVMATPGIGRQITTRLSSTALRDQARNRPAGGRFPWQASDGRSRTPG